MQDFDSIDLEGQAGTVGRAGQGRDSNGQGCRPALAEPLLPGTELPWRRGELFRNSARSVWNESKILSPIIFIVHIDVDIQIYSLPSCK